MTERPVIFAGFIAIVLLLYAMIQAAARPLLHGAARGWW